MGFHEYYLPGQGNGFTRLAGAYQNSSPGK